MTEFANATFTGTDGTDLPTADSNWTEHPSFTAGQHVISDSNRARPVNTSSSGYYHSGVPASADYEVSADLYFASLSGSFIAYVCGRMSTTANTFYYGNAQYGTGWKLNKVIGGTFTQLGSTVSKAFSQGSTYNIKLHMSGDQISLYTEGGTSPTIGPITDTAITDANKAGIRSLSSATPSNTVGIHVDNFIAADLGGGTTYTEPLTALAESYAAVTDIATYIAAAEAIITAGASVADTVQMLEGVLTAAESASSAADVATRVESLLATIQAVDSVATAATLVEAIITEVAGIAEVTDTQTSAGGEAVTTAAEAVVTVADVQQMQEQLLTAAGVAAAVTDTAAVADTVQTDATAAATVQDITQMLEQVYTAASAQASVTDTIVSGVAENLLTSATAITSATDVQLMVDNLTIMAVSGASIGEIYSYLEQLATAATTGASVTDILVTQFVGRYLFLDLLPLRSFTDRLPIRSFTDTPRGRA